MEYFRFILRTAFDDFKKNKLRTFLTSLGILIGVSSVILLNSFGLGLKKYIQQQFEGLGANMITAMPGKIQGGMSPSSATSMLGGIRFDLEDYSKLSKIKNTAYVSPIYTTGVIASAQGKSEYISLAGSNADIFAVLNTTVDKGRLFTKEDVEKKSKVAVLGYKVAEKIFTDKYSALNKNIKLSDQNFKVVGILNRISGFDQIDDHNMQIILPYTSLYAFNPENKFFAFYIGASDKQYIKQVKEDITNILRKRYKENEFTVLESTDMINSIMSIFTILNMVLLSIGAISLLVGGIGIMNIMYISVTEKIAEIGIRRAVGATQKDILYMFLSEAVILSLFGGLTGLLLCFIIVELISSIIPVYIDFYAVLITILISSLIGIVFGILPAKKAADLTPIEAIRIE